MAVAGLHNASGLDSYLGNIERSITRTASIRKMWRDLENGGGGKENGRLQTSSVIIGPESPCSSSLEGESMESEHTFRGANEIENECTQSQNQMVLQEKEGVRKLFHERGNKSFEGHEAYGCKRVRIVREWIESSSGDTCRTPGSVEPPTQTGLQIDGARSSIRRIYGRQALLDLLTKFVGERKREVDDLLENRFVSSFAHRHRIQSLLKGRFLRNQRFLEDEKPTSVAASELRFLRRTNAVSDIRKGFLTRLNNYDHAAQSDSDTSSNNEMNNYAIEQAEEIVQENFEITNLTGHRESLDPPESSATGAMHDNNIMQYEETEKLSLTVHYSRRGSQYDTTYEHNGQLEQVGENFETTNFTSNRESTNPQEYTQSDSDSDTSSDNDMKFDHIDQAEEIVRYIPSVSHIPQESHDDGGWYQETVGSDFQESHEEEWYGNGNVVEDPTESLFGGNNSYLEAALVTRSNAFYWSDEDDDDTGSRVVELRELTNRRRVSNLLQSDFGPRLDRLMQSYVSRQDQAFEPENEWMQGQDQQQSLDENEDGIDVSLQTHDEHDFHGAADSRFPEFHYHLTTELDIIDGLRIDMETLEQRMNDMQKMLEACMDMQVELQQSVQQEVYSALNRSSPENRECFLCCDDGFESLPDRFAQMLHICSKCAQKVNWSELKESVNQLRWKHVEII